MKEPALYKSIEEVPELIKLQLPAEAFALWYKVYARNSDLGQKSAMECAWVAVREDYQEDYDSGIWFKKEIEKEVNTMTDKADASGSQETRASRIKKLAIDAIKRY